MARPKSVVLTKEEKKNVLSALKAQLKIEKTSVRVLETQAKEADRVLAKATREHAATLKLNARLVAAATKAVQSLEAQIAALTAPTSIA